MPMMAFPWQSSMDRTKSCPGFVDKVNAGSECYAGSALESENMHHCISAGSSIARIQLLHKLMASASRKLRC
jgi:hypothetical protein